MAMSKTMTKFFEDMHLAEFGYKYGEKPPLYPKADAPMMVKLLKRCLTWKTYNNLYLVCEYLGAETDARADNIAGCKEIIKEDLDYWQDQINK